MRKNRIMNSLRRAAKEFISHCRLEKNLSPKTLKAYSTDINQLDKFLSERSYSIEISRITKVELREFLHAISSLKPKSIKRKIATVKAMFNYFEFEDRINFNPLRKMRIKIKEPNQLPRVMDIQEIKKIFNSAYNRNRIMLDVDSYSHLESLRNIVVVELLFATGARVSEIANLKMEDINLTNGVVTIQGKGNKERIIQICNTETLRILNTYSNLFSYKIIQAKGFFLVNRFGNKLSDQSIRNIVKVLRNNAGIERNITPHVFRHTFATLLLEKDVDIKYISSLLGHSSIITTQIYTHVNREKQRQILSAKHPRKDFSMDYSLVSE